MYSIAVFLLFHIVTSAETGLPIHVVLAGSKCKNEISKVLQGWGNNFRWSKVPEQQKNVKHYLGRPRQIGVYADLFSYQNGIVELAIRSSKQSQKVIFKNSMCKGNVVQRATAQEDPTQKPNPGEKNFGDQDLRALVTKEKSGAIITWSPEYPLSLLAIEELRKAAKERKILVFAILAPYADDEWAARVAKEGKLVKPYWRLKSVELASRSMTDHYPAVLVFHNGKLGQVALLGHKPADQYKFYIDDQIANLQKEQ